MDMQGVLSLLLNCLSWGLLMDHIISDITLIGVVSVLSAHEDHCRCESPGGVAWLPTCPMRSVLVWRAACCYLGDCSAPLKICTTHTPTCLQGSLEEIAINIQHLLHVSRKSAATWILLPVLQALVKSLLRLCQVSKKWSVEASDKEQKGQEH